MGAQAALSRVSGGGGVCGSAAEPMGDGAHAPAWEPGSWPLQRPVRAAGAAAAAFPRGSVGTITG